jgi:PAS domain S-box-containing protein
LANKLLYDFDNMQADYSRLFEESPIPMFIYNTSSLKFLSVNAAAILYYGYNREEFLMMSLNNIRVKGDKRGATEIRRVNALNSFYESGTHKHIKKNGEAFYVQVYSHTATFAGRTVKVMLAIDINKKVLAEKKNEELNNTIRDQKSSLDNILSSINDVIWSSYADDFTIVYVNEASRHVFGYAPSEVIGKNNLFFEMIHPSDREEVRAAWIKLFKEGNIIFECRIFHKDGSVKYIKNDVVLIPASDGDAAIINGISTDMTSERTIEETTKESARRVEAIFASITDSFFAVDDNWNFTYTNKAFEKTAGRKAADLNGKNIWESFPGVDKLKFCYELKKAAAERVSVHFEDYMPMLKKWFTINAYPSKEGLSVYLRNITEEKNQLIKIQEQNEALKQISWMQSHKMRAPVASILALAEVFNKDKLSDPVNKEVIENIRIATSNLDNIIKDIVKKTSGIKG